MRSFDARSIQLASEGDGKISFDCYRCANHFCPVLPDARISGITRFED